MPVYATSAEYETYSGQTPPADIDRLLTDASDLLDTEVLFAAVYDVDTGTNLPTDADVAAAFRDAVCAQVQYWQEVGEEIDISGPIQGVSIGSVNIQYGAGSNRVGPTTVAPRVGRILRRPVLGGDPPKLLLRVVGSPGGWW